MFNFKDPNDLSVSVPPVPDIKAWLNEFRSNHPNPNNNQEYQQQISSLNIQNDSIRMEFETMQINNKNIQNQHDAMKNELIESRSKINQLLFENNKLKQQNQSYLNEINKLKQQNNIQHTNDENTNNINQIQWNFNIDGNNNNNNNNNNNTNNTRKAKKRPRSESIEDECNSNKLSQKPSSSTSKKAKTNKNASRSSSLDTNTANTANTANTGILECRLPTNLDLIRGDILAEAGSMDQVSFCFNMLSKCSTDEWQLRNFLMQMICGLIEENQSMQYSLVYESRYIIKKQLTDLRSAIVKTTCEMLIIFSKYCDKLKYGQSLAYFIPIHLQGLYVTIACIRDAHNQCLTESINNIGSFKLITPLLKGLQNKHSEVRVKVINLLSSLLTSNAIGNKNEYNKKMEKYSDAIGNTIKTYISDANANVRDSVKKLFENFAKQYPQRAKSLLSRMDINSQKTLRKCINGNNGQKKTQFKRQTSSSSNYGQTRTRRK